MDLGKVGEMHHLNTGLYKICLYMTKSIDVLGTDLPGHYTPIGITNPSLVLLGSKYKAQCTNSARESIANARASTSVACCLCTSSATLA